MKKTLMILVCELILICLPHHAVAQKEVSVQQKVDEVIKKERTDAVEKDVNKVEQKKVDEIVQKNIEEISYGTFNLVWSKFGAESRKVVTGAPYSAVGTTQFVQTLADGNQIIRKNESTYYRDSEGRVRVEQRLTTLGAWTAAGEPARFISISDPISGYYYHLDVDRKTVRRSSFQSIEEKQRASEGKELVAVQAKLSKLRRKEAGPDATLEPVKVKPRTAEDDKKKTESLGVQTIEGVRAEGERTTRVIPVGEIGNTMPIEIVDERWYSPELQVAVMTRHSDPRSGESTYRLTNINRSEPDRSLFQVPSDYTILNQQTPVPKPVRKIGVPTPHPVAAPMPQPGAPSSPKPPTAPFPKMGVPTAPQPGAAPMRPGAQPSSPKPATTPAPEIGVPTPPQPAAGPAPQLAAPAPLPAAAPLAPVDIPAAPKPVPAPVPQVGAPPAPQQATPPKSNRG
jgi:hypothetical protein